MFMGRGRKKELLRNKNQSLQQRHWNYDHNEVLALIKSKRLHHMTQKELINPKAHMVIVAQKWNKITKEL